MSACSCEGRLPLRLTRDSGSPVLASERIRGGAIPISGYAAVRLVCFFADGCVHSSSSSWSAFNSAKHSGGIHAPLRSPVLRHGPPRGLQDLFPPARYDGRSQLEHRLCVVLRPGNAVALEPKIDHPPDRALDRAAAPRHTAASEAVIPQSPRIRMRERSERIGALERGFSSPTRSLIIVVSRHTRRKGNDHAQAQTQPTAKARDRPHSNRGIASRRSEPRSRMSSSRSRPNAARGA